MPKVPKAAPKYLAGFFEYSANRAKKRAIVDACLVFPNVLAKYWEGFREENEANEPKKPKKETPPAKKAENAVKNLAKSFGDIEDIGTREELMLQVQQVLGVDAATSAIAGLAAGGASDDVKSSVQQTIDVISQQIDSAKHTIETMQGQDAPAQPLIDTTNNILDVVQRGMDDISRSLHLERAAPVTSQKRKRADDEADAQAEPEDDEE